MRTIKQLIQNDKKVYIYLRNETVRQRYSHDADNEGITFEDKVKATERPVDDVMALLPGGKICFLGVVGHTLFGSSSPEAIRIDYEKYINSDECYTIREKINIY